MLCKGGIPPQTLDNINDIMVPQNELFLWAIIETKPADLLVTSLGMNGVNRLVNTSNVVIRKSKFFDNLE